MTYVILAFSCSLWVLSSTTEELEVGLMVKTSIPGEFPKIQTNTTFTSLLHDSDLLIDKSLFIKDIFESRNLVFLITCPHGWGKSVTMDMFKTFVEVKIDESGNQISPNLTSTYRLFTRGEFISNGTLTLLKTALLISQYPKIVRKHLAKYPVIHIRFTNEIHMTDFQSALRNLAHNVQKAYRQHSYAKNLFHQQAEDENLDDRVRLYARKRFNMFEDFENGGETKSVMEMEKSMVFLSSLLQQYFESFIVILIDDYSLLWETIFSDNIMSHEDKEKVLELYTNFMSETVKTNVHLKKAIITGTLPQSEELQKTALSDVTECNLVTGEFMQYYAINHKEIIHLLVNLNISINDGQHIVSLSNDYQWKYKTLQLYNPLSFASFSMHRKIQDYKINVTDASKLIRDCLKNEIFAGKFQALINGSDILVKVDRQYFTWKEYEMLIKGKDDTFANDHQFADRVFQHLYHLGYLTAKEGVQMNRNLTEYRLKIANELIKSEMRKY